MLDIPTLSVEEPILSPVVNNSVVPPLNSGPVCGAGYLVSIVDQSIFCHGQGGSYLLDIIETVHPFQSFQF